MAAPTDVATNLKRYRAEAENPRRLGAFLDELLGLGGRIACYETSVPNPSQQIQNKLNQAQGIARGGLLHIRVRDQTAHDKAVDALVHRWSSNAQWSKEVSAVALAYPDKGGLRVATIVRRAPLAAIDALRERLFPQVSVLDAEGADAGPAAPAPFDPPEPEDGHDGVSGDLFLDDAEFQRILKLLRRKKNVVLQGPPGVGKTYVANRVAEIFLDDDESRLERVQFHQSYAYEDFVQGFRPAKEGGFARRDGVFVRFCERARTDNRPHLLIVDEINRGNLSKIFGELLVLVEADKRGIEMPLAYFDPDLDRGPDGRPRLFTVPENVHLLGMMNTADRSLSLVDYALRRRFAFVDLRPRFDTPAFREYLAAAAVSAATIERICTRMLALNKVIREDKKHLGPGFEIGHSFFCERSADEDDATWYCSIVEHEIAPLLREYWFDDPDKAKAQVDLLLAP
jgi:5-methylcytosine-specific restriction protein B